MTRRTSRYAPSDSTYSQARGRQQQGPSINQILDVVHPSSDADLRRAGLFAASVAIRQGWTAGELADVLGALGVEK